MEDHYLLLTPGPLSTTNTVKEAMLSDWCTWDNDYKRLVQSIRRDLLNIAGASDDVYTSVLMQGSGTFCVESVIGTVISPNEKLLVIVNGAYGRRIVTIAERLGIETVPFECSETKYPDPAQLTRILEDDPSITHVSLVHCETTTGMMNPLKQIASIVKQYRRTLIVDAMSTFGGVPINIAEMDVDYLISSANKCIQGVPGFGFILAKREKLKACKHQARSHSLDLYHQWAVMEEQEGKWRFTSPTHTVRAFKQALDELRKEGGVEARNERYIANQHTLVNGMRDLGFIPLLSEEKQSPIITPFYYPDDPRFSFEAFYRELKKRGFVIYPGKVTDYDTFRIGNIGNVTPEDIRHLLTAVQESNYWENP
ncbi:2-aminoethylphosphonate--pyruvate transaminase [Halobacillus halophilus]|uniref:2-aminoethylphosphonate--pyruvate transaminase n=1 Tax=Halobacillus halophilus TaxID=1570 RepID=UPI001CD6D296|nr:2-aminoethylphosphonate--pyruvate transaminase [Halobacillus halophilus]MCA1011231.1 2-aminoethylphosphonate--pyruvate transaminase [Halobacillus halophilus]